MKARIYKQGLPKRKAMEQDGKTPIYAANFILLDVVSGTKKEVWEKAKVLDPKPVLEVIG